MPNSNKDAAGMIGGLKDRVKNLEASVSTEEGVPNLLRFVTDRMNAGDDVSVSVQEGGTWEWDSTDAADEYDGTDTWG